MTVRRPRSWQRVLALAPLLLVIASLPTQVLVRCRMDGQVRASCCCPADEHEATTPEVKAADCCHREVTARSVPTVRTAPETNLAPVMVATSIAYPELPADGAGARRIFRESPPARGGPPILLLKQTFLI